MNQSVTTLQLFCMTILTRFHNDTMKKYDIVYQIKDKKDKKIKNNMKKISVLTYQTNQFFPIKLGSKFYFI